MGFTNVYRNFIRNYTVLAAPLYELLRGNPPKRLPELSNDQKRAFHALIVAVLSPPIPFSIDTDASDYQIGWALFQKYPDGIRKPIAFWSRPLRAAEQNYSATEKECLAVGESILTCRTYLLGIQFDLHTDQHSLRWLMEIVDPSGCLMRWRLRLAEYRFDIFHCKGLLSTQADEISRLETGAPITTEQDLEVPVDRMVSALIWEDSCSLPEDGCSEMDIMMTHEEMPEVPLEQIAE